MKDDAEIEYLVRFTRVTDDAPIAEGDKMEAAGTSCSTSKMVKIWIPGSKIFHVCFYSTRRYNKEQEEASARGKSRPQNISEDGCMGSSENVVCNSAKYVEPKSESTVGALSTKALNTGKMDDSKKVTPKDKIKTAGEIFIKPSALSRVTCNRNQQFYNTNNLAGQGQIQQPIDHLPMQASFQYYNNSFISNKHMVPCSLDNSSYAYFLPHSTTTTSQFCADTSVNPAKNMMGENNIFQERGERKKSTTTNCYPDIQKYNNHSPKKLSQRKQDGSDTNLMPSISAYQPLYQQRMLHINNTVQHYHSLKIPHIQYEHRLFQETQYNSKYGSQYPQQKLQQTPGKSYSQVYVLPTNGFWFAPSPVLVDNTNEGNLLKPTKHNASYNQHMSSSKADSSNSISRINDKYVVESRFSKPTTNLDKINHIVKDVLETIVSKVICLNEAGKYQAVA